MQVLAATWGCFAPRVFSWRLQALHPDFEKKFPILKTQQLVNCPIWNTIFCFIFGQSFFESSWILLPACTLRAGATIRRASLNLPIFTRRLAKVHASSAKKSSKGDPVNQVIQKIGNVNKIENNSKQFETIRNRILFMIFKKKTDSLFNKKTITSVQVSALFRKPKSWKPRHRHQSAWMLQAADLFLLSQRNDLISLSFEHIFS